MTRAERKTESRIKIQDAMLEITDRFQKSL